MLIILFQLKSNYITINLYTYFKEILTIPIYAMRRGISLLILT